MVQVQLIAGETAAGEAQQMTQPIHFQHVEKIIVSNLFFWS